MDDECLSLVQIVHSLAYCSCPNCPNKESRYYPVNIKAAVISMVGRELELTKDLKVRKLV